MHVGCRRAETTMKAMIGMLHAVQPHPRSGSGSSSPPGAAVARTAVACHSSRSERSRPPAA
eukprot:scaffold5483_cov127-Isochrysis_galbana.AAC.2